MKKMLLSLFLVIFFGFPGIVSAESVVDFQGDYQLESSGEIEVTETIKYDFFDTYRHGIYRYIPYRYDYENGGRSYINISKLTVEDQNGQKVQFKKSIENGNIVLMIGDPQKKITGTMTYIISYRVKGGIRYLKTGDEFFWNVNGNGWNVPVESISARVTLPEGIKEGDVRLACWSGEYGSSTECATKNQEGRIIKFSDNNLAIGHGLSFTVGVPAGTFEISKAGFLGSGISDKIIIFLVAISISVVVLVFVLMLRHWWKKGRDPKGRGTLIAEYSPPENLTPIEAGTILDGKVDSRDISAEIIYLAVNGYLKIKKERNKLFSGNKNYTFIRLKEAGKKLKSFDAILLDGIFESADEVRMSELKKSFYSSTQKMKTKVYDSLVEGGYFKERVTTTVGKYLALAAAIFVIGVGVSLAVGQINNILGIIFMPAFVFSAIIIAGFGLLMPARTAKGVTIKEKVLGLKEYMKVAESDRLKFHNSPKKTPEKFEELLPYAIVLGVEKEWAKQFENIYKGQPSWYEDSTSRHFTPILFVSSINNFSSAVTTNMTTPSSASGSGFSGGGFSGGGFGGGGGGSW